MAIKNIIFDLGDVIIDIKNIEGARKAGLYTFHFTSDKKIRRFNGSN